MSGDVIALVRATQRTTAQEQMHLIVEWANEHGHRILRTIAPTAAELGDALAAVRSGQAVALAVADLSALGGPPKQEALRAEAGAVGGALIAVRPADAALLADDADDATRILLRLYGAARETLRAQEMRSRLGAGRAAAQAAGKRVGGRARYGWRIVGGELVEETREQAVLVRMRELWDEGHGYAPIARQLGVEGYLTQDGKAEWTPTTVKRIIDREFRIRS